MDFHQQLPLTSPNGISKEDETTLSANTFQKRFAVGELFAGAGGMALGTHKANYKNGRFVHVWANDIDEDACHTLRNNLPIEPERVVCQNVEKLDFHTLPAIDGLVFGFPCNDFSLVGDRRGIAGHYGALYKWGAKALEHFRPSFFVAENVGGLRNSNKKKDFDIILNAFKKAGYELHVHNFHFEDYGIPQRRHRIIIVGFKKSLNLINNYQLPPLAREQKSAKEAITCPPIATDAKNNERTAQSAKVIERLSYIKQGQNVFNATMPEHLRLKLTSGAEISQIYKRLTADAPSYTVTGSGGGGTHVYHWEENRALTNRERARLQTFPDDFVFCGGKESVRKQIGMAVPPEGARIIMKQILMVLIDNAIESVHVNR